MAKQSPPRIDTAVLYARCSIDLHEWIAARSDTLNYTASAYVVRIMEFLHELDTQYLAFVSESRRNASKPHSKSLTDHLADTHHPECVLELFKLAGIGGHHMASMITDAQHQQSYQRMSHQASLKSLTNSQEPDVK